MESFNYSMAFYSLCFIGVSTLCTYPLSSNDSIVVSFIHTSLVGSVGYIIANIVNMVCRCIHHYRYISKYNHESSAEKKQQNNVFMKIFPNPTWFILLLLLSFGLAFAEKVLFIFSFRSLIKHVVIGGISAVSMLVLLYILDKNTVQSLVKLLKP